MLSSAERFKPEYFVQLLLTGKKKSVSPPLNYANDRQYSEYWTQIEKNLLRVFPMLWWEDKGAFGRNCCGETVSSVVNLKKRKYFHNQDSQSIWTHIIANQNHKEGTWHPKPQA